MSGWRVAVAAVLAALVAAACGEPAPSNQAAVASPSPVVSPASVAPSGTPAPSQDGSVPVDAAPIPLEVVETGLSPVAGDEGSATYAAVLRNPNESLAAVRMQILVDFLDASGAFVAGEEIPVTLLPGQVTAVGGRAQDAGAATSVHIAPPDDLVGFEMRPPTGERFTVEGVTTTSSGGQTHTVGTLVSSFATDQASVQLVAVYRDEGGMIVGGATGGVDTIPAGDSVEFEITEVSPTAEIVVTEVYWQVTQ